MGAQPIPCWLNCARHLRPSLAPQLPLFRIDSFAPLLVVPVHRAPARFLCSRLRQETASLRRLEPSLLLALTTTTARLHACPRHGDRAAASQRLSAKTPRHRQKRRSPLQPLGGVEGQVWLTTRSSSNSRRTPGARQGEPQKRRRRGEIRGRGGSEGAQQRRQDQLAPTTDGQ